MVLWELLTRDDPHHGMPSFQVVFAVGTQGIRPPIPSSCPADYSALIQDCWAENPQIRVSPFFILDLSSPILNLIAFFPLLLLQA